MNAPRLDRYTAATEDLTNLPPIWQETTDEVFVVTHPGEFGGVHYGLGDVLVCRGDAVDDEPVVLMARGHGRPRLGWVRGDELYGEVGEPCSVARWRAAGRIVAVMRADARSLALVRPAPAPMVRLPGVPAARPMASAQLSLFSQAA
ncbi:MAG: hypothetical protein EP330_24425 [Deltaproteobacteria bacterium]|nr:MAG: hypothetical protein EP330_24425 [Deltaproteobacteria bacterium]